MNRRLVQELAQWIGCERCCGRGDVHYPHHAPEDCRMEPCPKSHVVVSVDGVEVHADPERVRRWCTVHDRPIVTVWVDGTGACGRGYGDGDAPCGAVMWRPVVPLNLTEVTG